MPETVASIQIDPFPNDFGATTRGLDLRVPLSGAASETIRQAWARHGVLVFPEQSLDHDELERFTLGLGDFGLDPFI